MHVAGSVGSGVSAVIVVAHSSTDGTPKAVAAGVQVQYSVNSSAPAVNITVQATRVLPTPQLVPSEQQALRNIYDQCGP